MMNLSVFSRINLRSVEKATTMSKRIQEKRRKKNLRKQSQGQCVSFQQARTKGNVLLVVPDVSNIPGNPQLDSGSVEGATRNCRRNIVQNRVPNPETCSQVLKRDNQSQRVCGEIATEHCPGRFARQLQRGRGQLPAGPCSSQLA